MSVDKTAVLVVGGGLTGLSAAAFLAWNGVPTVLVERHADLLIHPRARAVNARAMELYRQIGLADAVLAASARAGSPVGMQFIRAETLASEEYDVIEAGVVEETERYSPMELCMIDQDRLELVLRDHARGLGAEVHFSTELTDLTQDAEGVTATVRSDNGSTVERTIRADYVIAADGINSPVRQRLGIPLDGPGVIAHVLTAVFEADLSSAVAGRPILMCHTEAGMLMAAAGNRWLLGLSYFPERGERPEDYPNDRLVEVIRSAAGLPSVEVDLIPQIPGTDLVRLDFVMAAQNARRYRDGRILVAGDAAHVMPPTGGFGGSTCVQDAQNLVWKLAAVHHGHAGPSLLDTYETERRPVAEFTVGQALARSHDRTGAGGPADQAPLTDYNSVILGYRYRSSVFLADSDSPDDGSPVVPTASLAGQVGTRAPHVVLADGTSTIDRYGRDVVVLAGPDGDDWVKVADDFAAAGRPVRGLRIGHDLVEGTASVAEAHGIGPAGVVVIRPDGFVSRRSPAGQPDPAGWLTEALDAVLPAG